MDEKPFFTLDLSNIHSSSVKILENFTKVSFNLENILDSAEALKYIKAIRNEFEKDLQSPSDEMVKLLVSRFYDKPLIASRMATFKEYTRKAFSNSINDSINFRLKHALSINDNVPAKEEHQIDDNNDDRKIITSEEEIEGFQIVKAILRQEVPAKRIAYRDTQSYFGILLDDNNRKPLCRLYFNTNNKYMELFHKGKDNGEKRLLHSLDDIYNFREELLSTLSNYQLNVQTA
jgi:hypothetical protein